MLITRNNGDYIDSRLLALLCAEALTRCHLTLEAEFM